MLSPPQARPSGSGAAYTPPAGHQARLTGGQDRLPDCSQPSRAPSPPHRGPRASPRPAPSTPASHMRACPALTLEIHAGPAIASTPLTPATAAAVVRSRAARVRSPPPLGPAPGSPALWARVGDFPSTLRVRALDTRLRWPIAGLVSRRLAEQRPGSCWWGSLVRVLPLPLHS